MGPPRRSGAIRTALSEEEAGVLSELQPPPSELEQIAAVPDTRMGAFDGAGGGDTVELYKTHLANLAGLLTDQERHELAMDLLEELRDAEDARRPFHDQMVEGIRALGFDRRRDKRSDPFPGASGVIHPAFAQACIDMHARTAAQLSPPEGPCRTKVLGKRSEAETERADRVARHMNWQCTTQMREWQSEHDRLLMMVGPEGSSFKKLWYDPVLRRPRSLYVPSEYIVMPYAAADHMTSPLVGEKMMKLEHDIADLVRAGFWLQHDLGVPIRDAKTPIETARDRIQGLHDAGAIVLRNAPYRYWETQVTRSLGPRIDGGQMGEYLVTIAEATQTVVAIRRHWCRSDRLRERRGMLQHYKLFPWDGPYGLGLWHLIGGLGHAATGALRALLDSAHWINAPGGFRLAGTRLSGNTISRKPGEYPEIQVPTTGVKDIRAVVMPDPHPGPSTVLFELLGFLVRASERFASIALQETAESKANVPVGTTLARIDEGSRVYSEVFRRLHVAEGRELQEIFAIDRETIHEQMFYYEFVDPEVTIEDFRPGISIVPVSDPRAYSQMQRAMQAEAKLQLVERAADKGVQVDLRQAFEDAAKAMQLEGADKLFPDEQPPLTTDPFTENIAAFQGRPLQAEPKQPHEEHMTVHLAALALPGTITTPVGKILFRHYLEHASLGALWLAAARHQQGAAGVDPMEIEAKIPDPGQWYEQKMQALQPALLPPPDPTAGKLAAVEEAKVEATRERTDVETKAKIEVAREQTRLKLSELQLEHQQKMAEIAAGQDDRVADSATRLAVGDRGNASKERIEAMWAAVEMRKPQVDPRELKAMDGAQRRELATLQADQVNERAKQKPARK